MDVSCACVSSACGSRTTILIITHKFFNQLTIGKQNLKLSATKHNWDVVDSTGFLNGNVSLEASPLSVFRKKLHQDGVILPDLLRDSDNF